MNELIGSAVLTVLLAAVLYFVFAAKARLGFDSTIFLAFPLLLILGLVTIGFSTIYAFATIMAAILLAFIFNRFLGNK
jgi:hypothetical protein